MEERLKDYRNKRDFDKTNEPNGLEPDLENENNKEFLKFVVQYHIARRTHYDFRLEWRGVLISWAIPKGPSYNPNDKRLAIKVEDHPLGYANFEGLIPKGQYGGGTVMLWDEGVWASINDFEQGLNQGVIKIVLCGSRLKGAWTLIKIKNEDVKRENDWLMIKENDEYIKDWDGISHFDVSVRTGNSIEQINELGNFL